jgi:hypothetical protein
MSTTIFSAARALCAAAPLAATLLAAAGCATLGDAGVQQQLEVHAILDHREVAGVGCVLSNDAGRWFVLAPGRVTVARSRHPLAIDCGRQDGGGAVEQVASRYDTNRLIGNVVISAGAGYLVDRHSGAGFAYPPTLTVLLHAPQAVNDNGASGEGAPLF